MLGNIAQVRDRARKANIDGWHGGKDKNWREPPVEIAIFSLSQNDLGPHHLLELPFEYWVCKVIKHELGVQGHLHVAADCSGPLTQVSELHARFSHLTKAPKSIL